MAAINFPDAPTNGQIFESGGMSWTYVAGIGWTLNSAIVEAGSGFTFIADTMPLPVNVGDTWFDSSTGASGGTSWVAVEEGPAGASEKVWVQFAPGLGAMPPAAGIRYGITHHRGYLPANVAPPYGSYASLITINMPAAPAGTVISIAYTVYVNVQVVGASSYLFTVTVNGSDPTGQTLITSGQLCYQSWSTSMVNVPVPTGIPYAVTLRCSKESNGGGALVYPNPNTAMHITAYYP